MFNPCKPRSGSPSAWFAALSLMCAAPAAAQTYRDSGGTLVPGFVPLAGCSNGGACAGAVSVNNPSPVSDGQSLPFQGAIAMTVGAIYPAQRSIGANCTAGGNLSVMFPDASVLTVPVYIGWQTFPFAAIEVNSAGTTATCVYENLK